MTSTDTLLPCPFCGSQAAWPEPEVNMNYVQCMSCSATANHAGEWNRRTTPPPATDEREAVARALIVAAGAELVASEKHWPETAAQYYTMCEKYQSYAASHGLVTDAFRNADAALSALAPIRAQEIAAASAEEQGYRHTQVAALKQVHAAEILAAEANERARIAILLDALVDISKAAMIAKAMCDDADREPWQMIADRARKAIDAHLGRHRTRSRQMSDEGMSGEMLERYARGEASVPIPTFTRDVYRHLLARIDAAERERDALREALAKIANYDRKHKTPQRDGRMADTTHLYLQGFARAALTANHSAPVVEG